MPRGARRGCCSRTCWRWRRWRRSATNAADAPCAGASGSVVVPERGPQRSLVDLAHRVARHLVDEPQLLRTLVAGEVGAAPRQQLLRRGRSAGPHLNQRHEPFTHLAIGYTDAGGIDHVGMAEE